MINNNNKNSNNQQKGSSAENRLDPFSFTEAPPSTPLTPNPYPPTPNPYPPTPNPYSLTPNQWQQQQRWNHQAMQQNRPPYFPNYHQPYCPPAFYPPPKVPLKDFSSRKQRVFSLVVLAFSILTVSFISIILAALAHSIATNAIFEKTHDDGKLKLKSAKKLNIAALVILIAWTATIVALVSIFVPPLFMPDFY